MERRPVFCMCREIKFFSYFLSSADSKCYHKGKPAGEKIIYARAQSPKTEEYENEQIQIFADRQ